MKISNLTFIVTDECNFNCTYCFQQKQKKAIGIETIDRAVNYFYPYFSEEKKTRIGFYGGEPLLAYEQIVHAVETLKTRTAADKKQMEYYLTTNGSQLTNEKLAFFNRHKFALTLSYDGIAQEEGRQGGSREQMERVIKQMREYPGIELEINSVFSPATISLLFESIRSIVNMKGPDATFTLSTMEEWDAKHMETLERELERLSEYLLIFYKETGRNPVRNFQTGSTGVFRCSAGREQVAVSPGGEIWGCFLLHDYFKGKEGTQAYRDYSLGRVGDYEGAYGARYPRVMANYEELSQDMFRVEAGHCFLCEELEGCMVCPVNAAYSSGEIGKITCNNCRLMKLQSKIKNKFQQKLATESTEGRGKRKRVKIFATKRHEETLRKNTLDEKQSP